MAVVALAGASSASLSVQSPLRPEAIGRTNMAVMEREVTCIWEDRQCVSLVLEVDTTGAVYRATALESYASTRSRDSILAAVRLWRFEPGQLVEPAVLALDPGASARQQRGEPLPEPFDRLLQEPPFAEWLQALRSVHPDAGASYFRCYGDSWMYREPWENALADRRMRSKAQCGMLHRSPSGTYVLDPFTGIEVVDEDCRLGGEPDRGFTLYEAASGNQTLGDVGWNWVGASAWADDSTFVMAGTTRLEHAQASRARAVGATFPVLWVGKARSGHIRRYLGAPLGPLQARDLGPKWAEDFKRRYPQLHD